MTSQNPTSVSVSFDDFCDAKMADAAEIDIYDEEAEFGDVSPLFVVFMYKIKIFKLKSFTPCILYSQVWFISLIIAKSMPAP